MESVLFFEHDEEYRRTYEAGLKKTAMPDSTFRRPRFYNLVQLFRATIHLPGDILEAGCFRGLSSYLLCSYARQAEVSYSGKGFHIIDSFAGLSEPSQEDLEQVGGVHPRAEGRLYAASMSRVQESLSEFPEITYYKGWIPEILNDLPDRQYRFVHVDLDLYEPISASLEYFFPRVVPGGLIVVDDYGYLDFPGAKKAVDEFCTGKGISVVHLTTGNAVVIKSVV